MRRVIRRSDPQGRGKEVILNLLADLPLCGAIGILFIATMFVGSALEIINAIF